MRKRIKQPRLVRSTDHATNSKIVKRSKQLMKNNPKSRAVETFIKDAFGIKGKFVYIGM